MQNLKLEIRPSDSETAFEQDCQGIHLLLITVEK